MAERKAGRPKKEQSDKRTKQVMLTFTENEYTELQKMQKLLNQTTLTNTILYFMNRGKEAVKDDLVREM